MIDATDYNRMKKPFLKIAVLILTFLLISVNISCFGSSEFVPKAREGVLDLTYWDFERDGNIALEGEWEFYWKKLFRDENISHSDIEIKEEGDESEPDIIDDDSSNRPFQYVKVPSNWNSYNVNGENLDSFGYATYKLTILLNPNLKPGVLIGLRTGLHLTATRIFINDIELPGAGVVATLPEDAVAKTFPTMGFISNPGHKLTIIIQVSNYAHTKGGILKQIHLGLGYKIQQYHDTLRSVDIFLMGIQFIMILYHVGLYTLRRTHISSLLFAVFVFIIYLRSGFTGEKIMISLMPFLSYTFNITIEFLTFFWAMPVALHFLDSNFKNQIKFRIILVFYRIALLFSLIVFFTPVVFFSKLVNFYIPVVILGSIFSLYILIKSVIEKIEYSSILLAGFGFLALTALNDILNTAEVLYNGYLIHYGVTILIVFMSTVISMRFSKAFYQADSLSKTLEESNKALANVNIHLKDLNTAYSRFVPTQFLKLLGKENVMDLTLGEHMKKDMTLIFSDIRSFTALSESMTPEETFRFLNTYLSRVGPIIRKHNGFIDKYIGDGIMALFPNEAEDALVAAIEMHKQIREYNHSRLRKGYDPIRVGMGIHTGSMILGTIGENERIDGTVISDAVNLASRIEALTKIYEVPILMSMETLFEIGEPDKYIFRILDKVKVKGKNEVVTIIEVVDGRSQFEIDLFIQTKYDFENALVNFYTRNFDKATYLFRKVLGSNPMDTAARLYLHRSENFGVYGVEEEWQGIVEYDKV